MVKFDANAESYGRFLVAIAALDTQVTEALTQFTGEMFETEHRKPFDKRLKEIKRAALDRCGDSADLQNCLVELRRALRNTQAVYCWRHTRVHARVRWNGTSLSITDPEGRIVDFSAESFQARTLQALTAAFAISAYVDRFTRAADSTPWAELFRDADAEAEAS